MPHWAAGDVSEEYCYSFLKAVFDLMARKTTEDCRRHLHPEGAPHFGTHPGQLSNAAIPAGAMNPPPGYGG